MHAPSDFRLTRPTERRRTSTLDTVPARLLFGRKCGSLIGRCELHEVERMPNGGENPLCYRRY